MSHLQEFSEKKNQFVIQIHSMYLSKVTENIFNLEKLLHY